MPTRGRTDVTSEELAGLQRDALAGALAENLVHFLNNPITLLRANLRFLVDRIEGGEVTGLLKQDGEERITELMGALADIEYVVSALGSYARGREAGQGEVDLIDVVDTAYALVSVKVRYAADVELEGPAEPLSVPGHAGHLQQLVSCLLLHAEARGAEYGPLQARLSVEGAYAVLRIVDGRGARERPGDPRDELLLDPRICLAVARHVVAQHGGELEVDAPGGQGATYVVRLPLATDGG